MPRDLRDILATHRIQPRGVIHIGAHEGEELEEYRAMGAQHVLFIEANPQVYQRLQAKLGRMPGVTLVHCAIADYDGVANLRVTSASMSSSLLPLKLHKQIYPGIVETHQVQVPCRRVDSLLDQLQLKPTEFNIMHLDIQGAELMALKGAQRQMILTELIRTEVNRAELYEGCPSFDQIDAHLARAGYKRVAAYFDHHPAWGDAVYVGRPIVVMSQFGKQGRWGNQLFQYMFLRLYTQVQKLEYQASSWDGTEVFGLSDPPVTVELPTVKLNFENPLLALTPDPRVVTRIDLIGYFQFHTKFYAPHRETILKMFQPVGEFAQAGDAAMQALRERGRTIFALHLRRGDYRHDEPIFYIPPNAWYQNWLETAWAEADQPVLYIASDDPDAVIGDFAKFKPIVARDLPSQLTKAPYYLDYHVLRNADRVAISNSTFSFHACMMNMTATQFTRPSRATASLLPFDPWNDDPLWSMPKG